MTEFGDLVNQIHQVTGAQPAPTPTAPVTGQGQTPATTHPTHRNVSQTSLDDESVSKSDIEMYKGRRGVTDRVAIIEPGHISQARVHFIPTPQGQQAKNTGYLICNSEFATNSGGDVPVKLAPCCEKLDLSRKRFAALLCQFNTDPKGQVLKPFGFSLRLWRFNVDTFVSLRQLHKEWGLKEHDLLVTCTDEQYQKNTIAVCRESIIAMDDFKKAYGEQVAGWLAATLPRIDKTLGKRLTAIEWSEVLFGATATSTVAAGPVDTPVESIAQLLSVGPVQGGGAGQ
jgi:hypothetical protein